MASSMWGSSGLQDSLTRGAAPTSAGGVNNSTGYYKEKIPKGYGVSKVQQFTPEQMELLQSLYPHVDQDSFLSKLAGGDQSAFSEMEAPAYRQFNEQIGNVASRFSQPGTGARRSSGFQNAMTQGASNFAQDLQSKRQDYMRQARQDLFQMAHQLMGERPYQTNLYEKPQKQGFDWGGIGGAALGGLGGFFAGGPAGAISGANLGYGIGSGKGGEGNFQSTPGWTPGWGSQNYSLASGYDQEFRMDPSRMGY